MAKIRLLISNAFRSKFKLISTVIIYITVSISMIIRYLLVFNFYILRTQTFYA